MYTPMLNIGSEEAPDLICVKKITRYKKVPKTNLWDIYIMGGTATDEVPIQITDDQYEEIQMMMMEKELKEEKEEHRRPEVKRMVVLEEDSVNRY